MTDVVSAANDLSHIHTALVVVRKVPLSLLTGFPKSKEHTRIRAYVDGVLIPQVLWATPSEKAPQQASVLADVSASDRIK